MSMDPKTTEYTATLKVGDKKILYTDGLEILNIIEDHDLDKCTIKGTIHDTP